MIKYLKILLLFSMAFSFIACEKKIETGVAKVHWDRDMCVRCVMVVSDRKNTVQIRNPDTGKTAGELIEKSGFKGVKINDAMVSQKHANFIININNATCEDVLLLRQQIQETVLKKYHIKLETEVRVEGE